MDFDVLNDAQDLFAEAEVIRLQMVDEEDPEAYEALETLWEEKMSEAKEAALAAAAEDEEE